jgi:hypothetical protein
VAPSRPSTKTIPVYLEMGTSKVFACALDWPGWCRAGRTEPDALDALAGYAPRYAEVARRAGAAFPVRSGGGLTAELSVVERVPGSATTNFGAPGEVATADRDPVPAARARADVHLLRAAWELFDEVAAASPAELRKGPRGGGRDRDKMIDHVLGAETSYARKISIRQAEPARDDRTAIGGLRDAIAEALGRPAPAWPTGQAGWPPRYLARRIAWHVLDHAWEMQDRAG